MVFFCVISLYLYDLSDANKTSGFESHGFFVRVQGGGGLCVKLDDLS